MRDPQVVEVQQGIWIDERWLRNAELGSRLQVVIQPGEIRIQAAPTGEKQQGLSKAGWVAFRSLGQDAQPGRLQNAAKEHDRYLYRRKDP